MTDSAMPSGWKLLNGTLGTDLVIDTSVALNGSASFKFPSTATSSAVLVSDWVPSFRAVAVSDTYVLPSYGTSHAHVRASSVAANKDVKISVEVANDDKTSINTWTLYNAPLAAANTWELAGDQHTLGSTTYVWMRLRIERPTDIDFNLWVDQAYMAANPPNARLFNTDPVTFTGAWNTVTFDAAGLYDQINVPAVSSVSSVTITRPGFYTFNAYGYISDSVADGDMFGLRIKVAQTAGTKYFTGTTLTIPAAYAPSSTDLALHTSGNLYIYGQKGAGVAGEVVSVEIKQLAGSFVDLEELEFSIVRIGP